MSESGDGTVDPLGPYVNDAVAAGLVVGFLAYLALVAVRGPAATATAAAPAIVVHGWLLSVGVAVAWVFGPETVRAVGTLVAAVRSPAEVAPGPDRPDPPGARPADGNDGAAPPEARPADGNDGAAPPEARPADGNDGAAPPEARPADGGVDPAPPEARPADGNDGPVPADAASGVDSPSTASGRSAASTSRRRMIQTQTPGLDAGLGALLALSVPAALLVPALPPLPPLPVVRVTPPAAEALANLADAPGSLVLAWVSFATVATVWAFGVRAARALAALRSGA